MIVVYHRTTAANCESILRDGFHDSTGTYLTDREWSGVWVSDEPLDENEGACGTHLLRIELRASEADMADYEWIEEGRGFREWLLPAALVNLNGTISIEHIDPPSGRDSR